MVIRQVLEELIVNSKKHDNIEIKDKAKMVEKGVRQK